MQRNWKAVLAVAGILATAGVCGCGAENYKKDTSGSEQLQQKVKEGQPLYTPPPGAPIPPGAIPGSSPGSPMPGAPGAPR